MRFEGSRLGAACTLKWIRPAEDNGLNRPLYLMRGCMQVSLPVLRRCVLIAGLCIVVVKILGGGYNQL
jgi:hypothetical protein